MTQGMTYNSLLEDIKNYLDRGDAEDVLVANQIPRFIMLAENRLAREARSLVTKRPVFSNSMVAGLAIIAKPERWRETVSMNIGLPDDPLLPTNYNKRKIIYFRPYEFIREFWPDPTQLGEPQYYGDYDFEHFIIAPTPFNAYPFELLYYERIEPLSSSNQENFYTKYYPDMLLYACLLESAPFLKDDDRLQLWQSLYQQSLASLVSEENKRQIDNSQVANA